MKSSILLFLIVNIVLGSIIDIPKNILTISIKNASVDAQMRIVGGYTISIQKAPWTVVILYRNRMMCGGSIISKSKILSAAHCTYEFNRNYFTIRAGSSKSKTGGQVLKISKIINHPKYTNARLTNDISILFLIQSLKLSPSVALIVIDKTASALHDRSEVIATGWGKTCDIDFDPKCNPSESLQAVKLSVIGNSRCAKMYKAFEREFQITKSMLCAGAGPSIGGKDTCTGDSGGPLTYNGTLVGIVSFGVGCAQNKFPGVYTRVASFSKWISRYL